jgi:WD40 repeat protein
MSRTASYLVRKMFLETVLSGHTGRAWHVSWHPSGKLLATCGSDKCVRVWKCEGDKWVSLCALEGDQERTVRKCEWSVCGRYLASCSFDGSTYIWMAHNNNSEFNIVAQLEGHENEVKGVAWSTSGSYLATCGRDKTLWIWDAEVSNMLNILRSFFKSHKCK